MPCRTCRYSAERRAGHPGGQYSVCGGKAVADRGDIAQVDCRVADDLDRQVVQFADRRGAPFKGRRTQVRLIFAVPEGKTRFWPVTAFRMSAGASPLRLQLAGVHIDHHLALLAAERYGIDGAGNRDELRLQKLKPRTLASARAFRFPTGQAAGWVRWRR